MSIVGNLYFLLWVERKAIKIGWTTNLMNRLASLRHEHKGKTLQLLGSVNTTRLAESRIHGYFPLYYRANNLGFGHREWYCYQDGMKRFVRDILGARQADLLAELSELPGYCGAVHWWRSEGESLAVCGHRATARYTKNFIPDTVTCSRCLRALGRSRFSYPGTLLQDYSSRRWLFGVKDWDKGS